MSRTSTDEMLVQDWQRTPMGYQKDQKLEKVLRNFSGTIGQVVNVYRGAPVPTRTLELEAKRQAAEALADWKPGTGMTPASYVNTRLRQRLYRWVNEHQNVARIPEEHARRIGDFNRAVDFLSDRYGRNPSTAEIADHMGVSTRQVGRIRRMLRAEVSATSDIGQSLETFHDDPDYNRAMMAYYQLTEREKNVFDYLLGAHGQPQLKPGAIARKLNITPSRVSALKSSIARKIGPYLNG